MAMDFSHARDMGRDFDLIPLNTLLWANLSVRETRRAKTENRDGRFGSYIVLELVVAEGQPHANRYIWKNIPDPADPENTDRGREMGETAIRRILETRNQGMILNTYDDLSGSKVAIRVGVERGEDGFPDKNTVAEFLTPNPNSNGYKGWVRLSALKNR